MKFESKADLNFIRLILYTFVYILHDSVGCVLSSHNKTRTTDKKTRTTKVQVLLCLSWRWGRVICLTKCISTWTTGLCIKHSVYSGNIQTATLLRLAWAKKTTKAICLRRTESSCSDWEQYLFTDAELSIRKSAEQLGIHHYLTPTHLIKQKKHKVVFFALNTNRKVLSAKAFNPLRFVVQESNGQFAFPICRIGTVAIVYALWQTNFNKIMRNNSLCTNSHRRTICFAMSINKTKSGSSGRNDLLFFFPLLFDAV